jgi:ApaG protein
VETKASFLEPEKLWVTVDRVDYESDAITPPEKPHCFVYHISIHNETEFPITIKGRKWVVRNDSGEVTVVEGSGVVGKFPTIEPNESFSYNSYHLLETRSAIAEGSYLGVDSEGKTVLVRIPPFRMVVPEK